MRISLISLISEERVFRELHFLRNPRIGDPRSPEIAKSRSITVAMMLALWPTLQWISAARAPNRSEDVCIGNPVAAKRLNKIRRSQPPYLRRLRVRL